MKNKKYVLSAVIAIALYVFMVWHVFDTIGVIGWPPILLILDAALYLIVAAAWFTMAALIVRKCDKLIKPFIASLAQGAVGAGLFIFAGEFCTIYQGKFLFLVALCGYVGIALMIFGGVLLIVTAVIFFIRLFKSKKDAQAVGG